MAQANNMLGNNIMNPQLQQQKWMDKPIGDSSGLSYLRPLDSLLAKQVVSFTECLKRKEMNISKKNHIFLFLCSDGRHSITS